MSVLRLLLSLSVGIGAVTIAHTATAPPEVPGIRAAAASEASVFDPRWRTVLTGYAATELIDYCGRLQKSGDGAGAVTPQDLGLLEKTLVPLLVSDLRTEGSQSNPADYYRQYAAGALGHHRVIYVNGFRRRADTGPLQPQSWLTKPVIVMDGGTSYWCAYFIQDTGRFVTVRQDGRHTRTVAFHGVA
jgi:hypothetical protein